MFEIKVLRPNIHKAASSLNARLHPDPVTPPEPKPKYRLYGGLRPIRPAEIAVLSFLNHNKFMEHRGEEMPPATPASIAHSINLSKGQVSAALKNLVKNGYVVPVTAGYYSTERGFRANLNLRSLLIQE